MLNRFVLKVKKIVLISRVCMFIGNRMIIETNFKYLNKLLIKEKEIKSKISMHMIFDAYDYADKNKGITVCIDRLF